MRDNSINNTVRFYDGKNMSEEIENKFRISYDKNLAELLFKLKSTIVISTYQAGKIIFLGSVDGNSIYQVPVSFKKPMGIALSDNKIVIAGLDEIQIFSSSETLAKLFPDAPGEYDTLYVPRASYYCGETDLHDLAFGKGGLWAVNTKFSCLSTYDVNYSFTPRWKPPFISELKPEDRCHMNGLVMLDKVPTFVTALSQTDTLDGWRENITKSGILMKVPSGEIILDNLPMPHSPRMINKELYVLLSATGEIIKVNPETKNYKVILNTGGFIRGMTEYKNYLFVGLSKIRKTSKTFSKLPVSEMSDYSGIIIIDLKEEKIIGKIKYHSTVEEIYDVQILPNIIRPGLLPVHDKRHKSTVTTKYFSFWKKEKS